MCVIIYKPKGVEMPSNYILARAYGMNHDGCGIASPSHFYKGLSYNSFKRTLNQCSVDEPVLIHFRWATNGSVSKKNCHPFYDSETGVYFAHNGVLDIQTDNDMTDSETAFREALLPVIARYGLESDETEKAVHRIIGFSKFAFMQDDKVLIFGAYAHYMGCYYSNLRFLF
jgi:glutamine phosphoribosylpyrophosphate amidotransferase